MMANRQALLQGVRPGAPGDHRHLIACLAQDMGQIGSQNARAENQNSFHLLPSMYLKYPLYYCNSVQTQAASAEAAGKMTSSFSSWLFRLNPYFLPL